jgi:hypothetical protein
MKVCVHAHDTHSGTMVTIAIKRLSAVTCSETMAGILNTTMRCENKPFGTGPA